MADSYAFKVHLFELLRDPQQWAAFSESVSAAQRIAKGWGIELKPDNARALIAVLGRFQREATEATVDFVNAGFSGVKGDRVMQIDGPHASPFGLAASGVRGTGGGPHIDAWEWRLRIDASGMTVFSELAMDQ